MHLYSTFCISLQCNKGLNIATKNILVDAKNSNYNGRYVEVFGTITIESLIKAYAFALASDELRENQKHIGKRCVFLMGSLIRTALDAAIKEACGFVPEIQKTAQKHYIDAVGLIQELGFVCSASKDVATKKDITKFLKIPESTLNSFLRKYPKEIKPIQLDIAKIKSLGSKAKYMNGYKLDDVATFLRWKRRLASPQPTARRRCHFGNFKTPLPL
mgnify:CR=1 FL=1